MTIVRRFAHRCTCWLMLGCVLLTAPGCEDEQCDLNITLSGALEFIWVWKEGDACSINTSTLLSDGFGRGTAIRFPYGDMAFFEFTIPSLAVGTYFTDSVIYSQGGQIWDAGGFSTSPANCSVSIGSYELVDWVQNDHHRIVGALVCDAPLHEVGGDTELTVSNVSFTVYAAEGY